MANFGGMDTVPDQYQKAKRTFYSGIHLLR